MSPTHRPIKVFLADDHTLFREGVAEIFAANEGIRVVGQAETGEEALRLIDEKRPDVVLLDIEMPGPGAITTIGEVLRVSPSSRVVVLTMHDEPSLVRSLISSGAHGYVSKAATREELLAVVHAASRDTDRVILSVSRTTLERLESRHKDVLSTRELEVLSLAAQGLSSAQIAAQLYISEGTVKRHLTNIYVKLEVTSRVDAINQAVSRGLITSRDVSSSNRSGPSRPGRT